jgi:hypothetical protein
LNFLFGLLIALFIWLAPIVWAWRIKHPQRNLALVLIILLGPLGFLAALIILSHKPPAPVNPEDPDVFSCEHRNAPYRLSDYLENVDIFCSHCKQQMKRPAL